MVKQTLTPFEIIYGILSLRYGIPSIGEVLKGEILKTSQGSLHILFGIIFFLLFILGIYALFDGLCRLILKKTGVKIIESIFS